MENWTTRKRETRYQHGKWLAVESHEVELPDGRIIENWAWLAMPDFVIVVAVTPDACFLCFRQTKYAIGGLTLAPVGGYIEHGEDPFAAAQRELLEELGQHSNDWVALGTYAVDANRGAGVAHLYLARGVTPAETTAHSDDLEEQEAISLTRAEVVDALKVGQFKGLAWAAAMSLALLHLD
jgi:8-oxo-dGTP pyrophosphatase MutT (NUDIX family)